MATTSGVSDEETAEINKTSIRMLYAGTCMSGKVVDLGCNAGQLIPFLTGKVTEYTGIDGSEKLVEKAKNVARQYLVNWEIPFHFYALDFEQSPLPLRDGYASTCFMGEVLEHLSDPRRVLEEIFRVLRPGGTLILTTPLGKMHVGGGRAVLWPKGPTHSKEYSDYELLKLIDEMGFESRGQQFVSQNNKTPGRLLQIIECVKKGQSSN